MHIILLGSLWLLPLLLLTIGAWSGWTRRPATVIARTAVKALLSCGLVYVLALAVWLVSLASTEPASTEPAWLSARPLSWVVAALVLFIGAVVVRFSHRYMAGEPRLGFYYRWLLFTLGSVLFTVLANHLALLLIGWLTISVSLHRLLLFYPDRARTQLAAHKKFIAARVGELCLAASFYLLYSSTGTASIDSLLGQLSSLPSSWQLHAAAVLLVLAASLKCAQLPVHGWLIQVVDAPTPVSALLHAGVINLGGFILILFAPVVLHSELARWLLLVVAGASLVASALVMQTRVTVKVRLAWSTSAQMGFMLLECALGLFELALLHLVAHSLYKAHAFLSAGYAVQHATLQRTLPVEPTRSWLVLLHLLLAVAVAVTGYLLSQSSVSLWLLLGLSMALVLLQHTQSFDSYVRSLVSVVALAALLVVWKAYAASWLQLPTPLQSNIGMELWCMALLCLLLIGNFAILQTQRWQQRWQQMLFAGLFLDEWLTRLTQRLWPIEFKHLSHSSKDRQH